MSRAKIEIPQDKIVDFCRRWKVGEFALFGSALRDDFGPDSDVDVLVTFASDTERPMSSTLRRQRRDVVEWRGVYRSLCRVYRRVAEGVTDETQEKG